MTTSEYVLDIIRTGFEEMSSNEIVIAPWMAMGEHSDRLTEIQRKELHAFAHELSTVYSDATVLWFGNEVAPPFFREHAYYETLLSTASYLSYMRLGTLVITDEMILVANSLVHRYLEQNGGSVLLSVYVRVMFYLGAQLVSYYGTVPEDVFVSGGWHRPWTERPLTYELGYGIENGLIERINENGNKLLSLTDSGTVLYAACARDLEVCGYNRQREQLMRAANFTNMDDYEPMMERMNPVIHQNRAALLKWSQIRPRMNVLELGCGAGALTLDDGLYQVVGLSGRVIATDPSIGMLARAKKKLAVYDAANVGFRQAAAEQIPYSDNTFDAVIGMLFLHFTDIPKAFREIRRVTKPGGTFTTLYGLNFSKRQDFFLEWFEPLFRKGLVASNKSVLPDEDTVSSIAGEYFDSFHCQSEELEFDFSHVEDVVAFLVKGGTMAELNELPWHARNELFSELIRRGYEVKLKYGSENMKLKDKVQWFRGTVRK